MDGVGACREVCSPPAKSRTRTNAGCLPATFSEPGFALKSAPLLTEWLGTLQLLRISALPAGVRTDRQWLTTRIRESTKPAEGHAVMKDWRIRPHDPERIAALERAAGIPAVLAQVLVAREMDDPGKAHSFLNPTLSLLQPPESLAGCLHAADRIVNAIRGQERIVVFGDYDADGVTGTAILCMCLRMLGGTVDYYIPNRLREGYGLNSEAIRQLASRGTNLLVTVDCGIANVSEVTLARQLGMEVIVTDHHEPGDTVPPGLVVHPRICQTANTFGHLSGSGVALKLAWAICQIASGTKSVPTRMKKFLVKAVDLAALGTVADVVPLVEDNRVLVRFALANLPRTTCPSLVSLLTVSGLAAKPILEAEDLAFTLAPCLNAAGRLDEARIAADLLMTEDHATAQALAAQLWQLNLDRRRLEKEVLESAIHEVQRTLAESDRSAVVVGGDWHPGVIGIVAGRLARKYARPVVLLSWQSREVAVGSARSVPGVDLHATLKSCQHLLLSFGGHQAAAGVRIARCNVEAFREAFCHAVNGALAGSTPHERLLIDAETPFSMLTAQAIEQLDRLAPFGHGNPRPLFSTCEVTMCGSPRPLGTDGRHRSVHLSQHGLTMRAMVFARDDHPRDLPEPGSPIDVVFHAVINRFSGRPRVELHLADWREPQVVTDDCHRGRDVSSRGQ